MSALRKTLQLASRSTFHSARIAATPCGLPFTRFPQTAVQLGRPMLASSRIRSSSVIQSGGCLAPMSSGTNAIQSEIDEMRKAISVSDAKLGVLDSKIRSLRSELDEKIDIKFSHLDAKIKLQEFSGNTQAGADSQIYIASLAIVFVGPLTIFLLSVAEKC